MVLGRVLAAVAEVVPFTADHMMVLLGLQVDQMSYDKTLSSLVEAVGLEEPV